MKIEEWIEKLSDEARKNVYRFERIRECIPLGLFSGGEIALSHREQRPERYHFTFVTGQDGTEFIRRLAVVLACLYDFSEAQFLLLSPRAEFSPLLKLENADINALYLSSAADFEVAIQGIESLVSMRKTGVGYPKLFVFAEGLEEIEGLCPNDPTDPYIRLKEALGTSVCELVVSADLKDSRYFTFPGALIGIGNCLISTKEEKKADLTYVSSDSSLCAPREICYPSDGMIEESVRFMDSLGKEEEDDE